MEHLKKKLRQKLAGTKGALVKSSLIIDSWDEADSRDKEKVLRQWVEANASPYGGRVNRALLELVPTQWWTLAATWVAESVDYEDDEAVVNYGLELHDHLDPEDEDDRERLIISAGQAMWNQVEADILEVYRSREDIGPDDLPWQIDKEFHDISE